MIVGTGVDIVAITRFERFVGENNLPLLERLFTADERQYCSGKRRSAQHYALRVAAKEALLKALGTGLREGISWQDVEVVNNPLGKPELRLTGKARELAERCGARRSFLSLSHDGDVAIAMVVLEGEP